MGANLEAGTLGQGGRAGIPQSQSTHHSEAPTLGTKHSNKVFKREDNGRL